MDGQHKKNPADVITKTHGLRLIKGGVTTLTAQRTSSTQDGSSAKLSSNTCRNTRMNPLIQQLSALADAIDQDVAQILKL